MTVAIAVAIAIMVLAMLVVFPVVGLAMIPIVVLAVVVGGAWLLLAARRGARELPEHRAPGEPATSPPESAEPRGTRAGPSA
jgi:hypothetical protein